MLPQRFPRITKTCPHASPDSAPTPTDCPERAGQPNHSIDSGGQLLFVGGIAERGSIPMFLMPSQNAFVQRPSHLNLKRRLLATGSSSRGPGGLRW